MIFSPSGKLAQIRCMPVLIHNRELQRNTQNHQYILAGKKKILVFVSLCSHCFSWVPAQALCVLGESLTRSIMPLYSLVLKNGFGCLGKAKFWVVVFETVSLFVTRQARKTSNLETYLPLLPKFWDQRHTPPCLAFYFLKIK